MGKHYLNPLFAPKSVAVFGASDRVRVSVAGRNLGPLRRTYADGPAGELIALINSWHLVEAAANSARAIDRFPDRGPREIPFVIDAA